PWRVALPGKCAVHWSREGSTAFAGRPAERRLRRLTTSAPYTSWAVSASHNRGERGRPMKLSLVVLSEGKAQGHTIPITLPQFIIGRDPQCQLRPPSPMISKRHCALLIKGGKAFVRDFGSTN